MDLSIITITYSDPRGLAFTLDSLKPLRSTDIRWEHVIVDQSPLLNELVLQALESGWPLVRVDRPGRALGIYGAMNWGLKHASGRYVWFLNGGDGLRKREAVGGALDTLKGHPEISIWCGAAELTRDGEYLYTKVPRGTFGASLGHAYGLCHQGMIYRREVFERIGPYSLEYPLAADFQHHLLCLFGEVRAMCSRDCLAIYDTSGVSSDWRRVMRENRKIVDDLARRFPGDRRLRRLRLGLLFETARLTVVKGLAKSALAPALRPLWFAFQRRRSPRLDQKEAEK